MREPATVGGGVLVVFPSHRLAERSVTPLVECREWAMCQPIPKFAHGSHDDVVDDGEYRHGQAGQGMQDRYVYDTMGVRRRLRGLLTDAENGTSLVIDVWKSAAERTSQYERYLQRLSRHKHYRARPCDAGRYVSPIVQLRSNDA